MGKPVAMFEVLSTEPGPAQKFYAALFDWHVSVDSAMGGYGLVDTGAGESAVTGGIGPAQSAAEAGVKIYVRVDDLEAYLDRAEGLGGRRLVEPTELPDGYGRFAVLADLDGNPVGLWA